MHTGWLSRVYNHISTVPSSFSLYSPPKNPVGAVGTALKDGHNERPDVLASLCVLHSERCFTKRKSNAGLSVVCHKKALNDRGLSSSLGRLLNLKLPSHYWQNTIITA